MGKSKRKRNSNAPGSRGRSSAPPPRSMPESEPPVVDLKLGEAVIEAAPIAPETAPQIVPEAKAVEVEAADAGSTHTVPPPARPDADEPAPAEAKAEEAKVVAQERVVDEKKAAEPTSVTTRSADASDQWQSFFNKPVEEIHEEHSQREAPDLHDDDILVAPVRPKVVDRRAKSIVYAVVGIAALIGALGLVRRASAHKNRGIDTTSAAVVAAAPPPETIVAAAPPPAPPPVETQAAPPAPPPPPAETVTAPAAAEPAPAPTPTVAAADTTTPAAPSAPAAAATTAAAAPAEDPEAGLSGAQLLAAARTAIGSGQSGKAAALARKAAAKGAGGSAYYILGAATGSKSAYQTCAKSGCAEAAECASIADSM